MKKLTVRVPAGVLMPVTACGSGGHEFFGQLFEDAMSYILSCLEKQLSDDREEKQKPE
ncbi:MAG: hypothetical protein ACSW8K_09835 [bacterium]